MVFLLSFVETVDVEPSYLLIYICETLPLQQLEIYAVNLFYLMQKSVSLFHVSL